MWVIPLSLQTGERRVKHRLQLRFGHGRRRRVHSHEAKGAVGDEEEFLPVTNQAVQDSVGLFSPLDELIWEETGSVFFFPAQQWTFFLSNRAVGAVHTTVITPFSFNAHTCRFPRLGLFAAVAKLGE